MAGSLAINVLKCRADKPYALVLSSIVPFNWHIELRPGAKLERIVLRDSSFHELHSEVSVTGGEMPTVDRVNFSMMQVSLAGQSRSELDRVSAAERPATLKKFEQWRKDSLPPELLALSAKFRARIDFQNRYEASMLEVGPCPEGIATEATHCR